VYWDDRDKHFLAFRLDGSEFADPATSIYFAYNGWKGSVTATLPSNLSGKSGIARQIRPAARGDRSRVQCGTSSGRMRPGNGAGRPPGRP